MQGNTNTSQVLDKNIVVSFELYSGASDTIYYYPDNDTTADPVVLCTTDNSGHAEQVELTIPSDGVPIKLYSTVAVDLTNQSTPYSKEIEFTQATTSVYLMPEGTIVYWYGYTTGFSLIKVDGINPTQNTNYWYCSCGQLSTYKYKSSAMPVGGTLKLMLNVIYHDFGDFNYSDGLNTVSNITAGYTINYTLHCTTGRWMEVKTQAVWIE